MMAESERSPSATPRPPAAARPINPLSLSLSDKVRSLRLDNKEDPPPGDSRLPWLLVVCLLCSTLYLGYVVQSRGMGWQPAAEPVAKREPAASTDSGEKTASTEVAGSGAVVLESKGYIIPAHQILVSPKVSGMVLELDVEEGKRVNKGHVLAQLETTDYEADVRRATAMLLMAQQKLLELKNGNRPEEKDQAAAEVAEAETQLVQLERAYQRAVKLHQNKTINDTDYDQAVSAYRQMQQRVKKLQAMNQLMIAGARQERVELAEAEVKQAQAELAKAEWRLSNCTIRAPIAGTILKKNAEKGNIVNPVAFNGSFSLCEMADLSELEVELNIQERDVRQVFKGQLCTVRAEAFPDRAYSGYVSRLMPIADRAKGAIPVRVKIRVPEEEEGVYLKPEMGAIVSFQRADSPPEATATADTTDTAAAAKSE